MSALSRTRDDKWSQPGWRIEQKYGSKVLVGNWAEERLKFSREAQTACSTYRQDYQPQWESRPDVSVRRAGKQRAEGLPAMQFFSHHATPASHHLVSLYDESYGRRCGSVGAVPSARRTWHHDSLSWRPERSDHPVAAPPTNFGLLASQRRPKGAVGGASQSPPPPAWLPSLSESQSAYRSPQPPASALPQSRRARAPRLLSSHFHAPNHTNRDLHLRQPRPLLVVPDHRYSLPRGHTHTAGAEGIWVG